MTPAEALAAVELIAAQNREILAALKRIESQNITLIRMSNLNNAYRNDLKKLLSEYINPSPEPPEVVKQELIKTKQATTKRRPNE